MFCSEKCKLDAFKKFHRFECPIILQLNKSGSVHMAMRLFFTAMSIMGDSIDDLKNVFEAGMGSLYSIFDIPRDISADDAEKEKLKALICLVASSKVFDLTQHMSILRSHPKLKTIIDTKIDFVENFIQRMCQISDLNFHGIFGSSPLETSSEGSSPQKIYKILQKSIGTGAFLFNSMLNHSCTNNVLRICVNRKIITVVCKPITEGGQIFDCYK